MKVEHQWTFWMIIVSRWIVWMKDLSIWNVWMKLIPKELCRMKTTCTWKTNTKNMKYLNECGAWMNFWMINGSWRIIWMKLPADWMYGWKWFQNSYDKWKLLNSHNFHVQLHPKKKGVKGEIWRSYITMQKGETITCVN